jgi:thioredoxin
MNTIILLALTIFLLFSVVQSFRAPLKSMILSSRLHSSTETVIDCASGAFAKTVIECEGPVVVDFYADWCGPCKLVAPIFKQVSEEYPDKDVKFVKVDTDVHEDTVDTFNIQGLPLFGVFMNGKMIASHSGALNKQKLSELITKALS